MTQGLTKEVFTVNASYNVTGTTNSPTIFDGKNAWFTALTPGGVHKIIIVEFWGPYTDLDNTQFQRWAEPATDEVTLEQMGPKLRVVTVIEINKVVKQFLRNSSNIITAVCTDNTWVEYTTIGYSVVASYSNPKPSITIPPLFSGPFTNLQGVAFTPASKVVLSSSVTRNYLQTPNSYWAVEPSSTLQTQGSQRIFRYSLTTGARLSGGTLISGRRQFNDVYIAYANGKVYIGRYNEGRVAIRNETNSLSLGFINVNRDVEELFSYAGDIYVTSRDGVFSRINQDDTVTHLGASANRDYYLDLLSTVPDTEYYGIEQDAIGKYDAGSTIWDITTVGGMSEARYFKKSNRQGKNFKLYSGAIVSTVFTPELSYEYFIGSTLTTVKVPPHLLFFKNSAVKFKELSSNGTVLLSNGVTPVTLDSSPLSFIAAQNLIFKPNLGFTGNVTVKYTVINGYGVESALVIRTFNVPTADVNVGVGITGLTNEPGINAIRFPNIYYGGTDKQYGGVMAISTSINRYKGDLL